MQLNVRHIEIPFVVLEATPAVVWLLARVALCVWRRSVDWRRKVISLVMLLNVAIILRFAMFRPTMRA